MNKITVISRTLTFIVFSLMLSTLAEAQVPRTFVSVLGNDNFPCNTPLLPCRTIQPAITKVQAGGEVVIITSGSYQPFTVNKSVTVAAAPGEHVGISASSGHGAVVNAGPDDSVTLRGLTFNWAGGSNNNGIELGTGAALSVEGCVVNGFPGAGIAFFGHGRVIVKDTIVRNGGPFAGIYIRSQPGASAVTVDHCRVENVNIGVLVGRGRLNIRDSVIAGNPGTGVSANPDSGGPAEINMENSLVTGTTNFAGIFANGTDAPALIRVSNSTITDNLFGLFPNAGGSILTRGNNTVEGNNNDGSFTGSFAAK